MIKLSHHIITKGDEELDSLKYLFHNLDGIFSEVHITANGKKTTKLEAWCKENGYDYSYLEWSDDFSAQRNFNFARVSKGVDYQVWSDADDVIINPEVLVEIAELAHKAGHPIVYFEYWYGSKFNGKPSLETFVEPEIKHMRERLIKPGYTHWKGRLHETPVPFEKEPTYSQIKYSDQYPIAWLHLGADKDLSNAKMAERMERNRRILELELNDEREAGEVDPRTILYLMKIYAEDTDPKILKELQNLGEEYLSKSGWDEERAMCYRLMAMGAGALGQNERAVDLLHKAIKEYPYDPILYLHLARAYFNLKNFGAMRHWLEFALSLDEQPNRVAMANELELKVLSAELMLNYYYFGDKKNVRKAYQAAKMLNKVNPTKENRDNEILLADLKDLDKASEAAHKLMLYLIDIDQTDKISTLYNALPMAMQNLPFANHFNNKYKQPKVWEDNEICYYATFGQGHISQWSPESLKTGIGGSETAVIKLAKLWADKGWKVTVYGDPGKAEGIHDGVLYLPWYKFNPRDKFNIFIQWRSNSLAGVVSCKKYYVDLHDVFYKASFIEKQDAIDKLMVKSNYHAKFAGEFPEDKIAVIGNGVDLRT